MVTTIPPAMVDFVLKQPIDPNVRDAAGNTALHLAGSTTTSGHEYLKLVASLLQHGAVRIIPSSLSPSPHTTYAGPTGCQ